MSVFANTQCLLCHLNRNVQLARTLGTEEQATAFAKELMKVYISAPENASSPFFGPQTSELFHRFYGLDVDRFKQEKIDSNAFVLPRLPQIREKVLAAPDPVFAGLQFAILGNYIDFSALGKNVSFEKLDEMLLSALEMQLDMDNYASLCADLEQGKKLLYLTDNAGEIGFDRIFAEEIQKKYPHLEITFCVRGGPANNDALREDAEEETKSYIAERLKQAEWALQCISKRESTLQQTAECIVRRQKAFFLQAEGELVPLKLADVAEELQMHESTISRAVKEKYLQCERGIFPLHAFFSKALAAEGEDAVSADSIRQQIRMLIAQEDKQKPLSDRELTEQLTAQGIQISRRTVAKYREGMDIPSAAGRKQF